MQLTIEQLVALVVKEVLAELERRGMVPGVGSGAGPAGSSSTVAVDMTGYRTPVLTENRVRALGRHVREIVVPTGTVCTWGARDVLAQRKIKLTYEGTNH